MKKSIQIMVNGPEDLPKEDGTYFCCRNGFLTVQDIKVNLPEKSWLREIRWYLQPIEEPEEAVREELTNILNCIISFDKTTSLEAKGRYFEVIQRDIEKYLKSK